LQVIFGCAKKSPPNGGLFFFFLLAVEVQLFPSIGGEEQG
jgi:hypothetical protein